MNIKILPIYNSLFSTSEIYPDKKNWESFKTTSSKEIIFPSVVDFSITTNVQNSWKDTVKKIALIILKIILFPWILYEAIKSLVSTVMMKMVLLSQSIPLAKLDNSRKSLINYFNTNENHIVRHVCLEKNGVKYSGLLIGHQSNISNGNWILHADGNYSAFEYSYGLFPIYTSTGFNVLIVNGPNVGRSKGSATPHSLGEVQELGISFLESAVKAKKIALIGCSLGGAALGKAILNHTFKSDIDYLVIRLMTFDRLSNMGKKFAGFLGKMVVHWLGYEMDSIEASKKLQKHGIHEIVFQAEMDTLIDDASLLDALKNQSITENKTFHVVPDVGHNHFPCKEMMKKLLTWNQPPEVVHPIAKKRFFEFPIKRKTKFL